MNRYTTIISILSLLAAVTVAGAAERLVPAASSDQVLYGVPLDGAFAKAEVDSFLLMGPHGSGAPYIGSFEDEQGAAGWNGWTSVDETAAPAHWHASDIDPIAGAYSAWCGEQTPSWTGYGNSYDEILEWRGTVDDDTQPCEVRITAMVHYNVEPQYDFCYIGVQTAEGRHDLWVRDGSARDVPVDLLFTFEPDDYVGGAQDEVVIYFRVDSDNVFSDEDFYYMTGDPYGAMHVDDVSIALSNGVGVSHDFEDGTLGPFSAYQVSFGDYARIWDRLEDRHPCIDNPTPQVAFIDDGVVVPGTGGSPCNPVFDFCYGPGGFVVNTSGGLTGQGYLLNSILSPVMAWPDGAHDGAMLELDVYTDSRFSASEALITWSWSIRSTADPDPAMLEDAPWVSDGFLVYGGLSYSRVRRLLDFALVRDPAHFQIKLTVRDFSESWNVGEDASPGPYFDNVRVTTYPSSGPLIRFDMVDLAQDNFPEIGYLGVGGNLAANSVRFDAAENRSGMSGVVEPGDNIVFSVAARGGADLAGSPRLHYRLDPNPLFDPYRTSGFPALGSVAGSWRGDAMGYGLKFSADLPDTGFLFPGDVLHYYIEATDDVDGDMRTSTLPDTTGFSDFGLDSPYSRLFTVHALPSISGADGTQPLILFWNDGGSSSSHGLWVETLAALGLAPGIDFDEYFTISPGSGQGNGLGGRATLSQIIGYEVILYTSDSQSSFTLVGDPGNDLVLLDSWLDEGGRNLLLAGDHLASDIQENSYYGSGVLAERVGVSYVSGDDVGPWIGDQSSPKVVSGPPGWTWDHWYLNGECPESRTFDAVQPASAEFMAAGFSEAGGGEIAYPYAAATRHLSPSLYGGSNQVFFLPYGLVSISAQAPDGDKVEWGPHIGILSDVLTWFGRPVTAVPALRTDALRIVSHPNPFNPATEIEYSVPGPGRLEMAIYDLAGRKVVTLLDREVLQNGKVTWAGVDGSDRRVPSGVYFCVARFGERTAIRKIAMIK